MARYIPPYTPPGEMYWQTILTEGPFSSGEASGRWQWIEIPAVPEAVWEEARRLQESQKVLELAIDGYNRGGLIAHWKSVECFIPASHLISYPFPADPVAREAEFEAYVSQQLRLCIIEVEPARNRILLSERQVAECDIETPTWPDWLIEGNVCEGIVTSVRPFGAFVDIGPLEGMVHISEISWGRVRHPSDFLEPGQTVNVLILNVDFEHQRVALSYKRLQPNPWDTVNEHLTPGDKVTGEVVGVEKFGVFIELLDGLEGLLHISEIDDNLNGTLDLNERYYVGQKVPVCVLDIMPDDHRIALGLSEEQGAYV